MEGILQDLAGVRRDIGRGAETAVLDIDYIDPLFPQGGDIRGAGQALLSEDAEYPDLARLVELQRLSGGC